MATPYTGEILDMPAATGPTPYAGEILDAVDLPPPSKAAKPVVYETPGVSTPASFPAVDEATRQARDAERMRLLVEERKLNPADSAVAQEISNEQARGTAMPPAAQSASVPVPYTGEILDAPAAKVSAPAAPVSTVEEPYSIEGEFAKGAAETPLTQPVSGARIGDSTAMALSLAPEFGAQMIASGGNLVMRGIAENSPARSQLKELKRVGALDDDSSEPNPNDTEYVAGLRKNARWVESLFSDNIKLNEGVWKEAQADITAKLKEKGYADDVAVSTVASLMQNMPGLAAAIVTKRPELGLAWAGLTTKAGESEKAIQEGHTYEEASTSSSLKGIIEAAFEATPLGILVKGLGKEGLKGFLGKYILAEYATELPTTVAQNAVDWAILNPEKTLGEFAKETGYDLLVTAGSVPFSAGMQGGVASVAHAAARDNALKQQEKAIQDLLRTMGSAYQTVPPPPGSPPGTPPTVVPTVDANGNPLPGFAPADETQEIITATIRDVMSREPAPGQAALEEMQLRGGMQDLPATPYGTGVGEAIGALFGQAPSTPDVGGISPAVEARRGSEEYQMLQSASAAIPAQDWVVMAAPGNEGTVGLQTKHIDNVPDGAVVVLGGDLLTSTTLFPGLMPQAIGESVQKMARIAGIDAPIFVTLQQLEGGQAAGHQTITLPDGRTAHVINPREMPGATLENKGGNSQTAIDFIYSLSHEVGHGLVLDKLAKGIAGKALAAGMDAATANKFGSQAAAAARHNLLTPELMAELHRVAPTEAALINKWAQLQQAVRDKTISTKDFLDQWMGTRKFATGMLATKATANRYEWIEREARKLGIRESVENMDIHDAVRALKHVDGDQSTPDFDYVLNFDEYMAEQFSRAAHDRNYLKGTMLGTWYQNAIARLKEFFRLSKAEGIIPPGKEFNDWLDERTAEAKAAKRGRWYGHIKLNAKTKKLQAERAAALEAEMLELQLNGEQSLGEWEDEEDGEPPAAPQDEQAADLNSKEGVNGLIDVLLGLEPNMPEAMLDKWEKMLKQGQIQEVREAVEKRLKKYNEFQADRTNSIYTTTLLERLPATKELYTLQDLRTELNKPGLKQNDKLALQEQIDWLKANPVAKTVTYAQLAEGVFRRNVALTSMPSKNYTTVGAVGLVNRLEELAYEIRTTVWEVMGVHNLMLPTMNHFDNPAYAAHTRTAVNPRLKITRLYEVQSDFFQARGASASAKKIAEREAAIQTIQGWLATLGAEITQMELGLLQLNPTTKEWRDAKYTLEQKRKKQNDLIRKMGMYMKQIETQKLSHTVENWQKSAETLALSMSNKNWWQRTLREEMYQAYNDDNSRFFEVLAGKDLPRAEQWFKVWEKGQRISFDPMDLNDTALPYAARLGIINGIEIMPEGTMVVHKPDGSYSIIADLATAENPVAKSISFEFQQWLQWESGITTLKGDWAPPQKASMVWYDEEIIGWLNDTYGTTEVTQDGITWHRIDLEKAKQNKLWLWDKGNPQADGTTFWGKAIEAGADAGEEVMRGTTNWINRISDAFVQLHQRASQPLADGTMDIPMRAHVTAARQGEAYKNSMQQPANVLIKELEKRSVKEQQQMYAFLDMEWRGGESWFELQGWTADPSRAGATQIWGKMPDGDGVFDMKTGLQVNHWTLVPNIEKVKAGMKAVGIDANSQRGIELGHLILQMKQTTLNQFTNLQRDLTQKIHQRYGTGAIAYRETKNLYQVMQKIRLEPFFPQGRYGQYTVVVQEKKENRKKGERKMQTVRVEYFETKAAQQRAAAAWKKKAAASNGKMRVFPKDLEEYDGIPLQLPRNLLTQLENTGLYTKEQLQTMSDMMLPLGHEKLAQRYDEMNEKILGGEKDLLRNYANFAWHNSNFIWKMRFRGEFAKALNAQNALIRKASMRNDELGLKVYDELVRNKLIMERTKEYMLYPPYEFQTLKGAAALTYLALNPLSAVMNLTTIMSLYFALTQQRGELEGGKLFMQAIADAGRIFALPKDTESGHITEGITAENSELVWLYNKATSEGVIDASYSFFLAGQTNQAQFLRPLRKGVLKKVSYYSSEVGMFPFRAAEKSLRLATLNGFYQLERDRGVGMQEAYAEAVLKVDQLQGAYDQANRAEIMRGKKGILFMFAGFLQMMVWNTMGGYGKATNANLLYRRTQALAEGNQKLADQLVAAQPQAMYAIKQWMFYMLMGGLWGGPFMENIKEILRYFYRLLFKTDMLVDFRTWINELGGGGHWYNKPDFVEGGVLHDFFGFDLSARMSLGRVIPFMDMINKDATDPEAWLGSAAVQASGPFGGWSAAVLGAAVQVPRWIKGEVRGSEVLKSVPGMIGYISQSYDAYVLQQLQPGEGMGIVNKQGVRMTEDPVGSGNFRDLTNGELVGLALGAKPTFVNQNREAHWMQLSEQVYWNTRIGVLLDARFSAIHTGDDARLEKIDEAIEKFNDSLPEGYESLTITGRMKAESLKAKSKGLRDKEMDRFSKRMRGPGEDVKEGYDDREAPGIWESLMGVIRGE